MKLLIPVNYKNQDLNLLVRYNNYIYKDMTKQQLKDLIKEVLSEVDKSSLHKELIAINDRIKYMRSFTNYGDTISGSHVKDQLEIGKLTKRKEEILKALKSTNENYEDGIKDTKDRFAYLALRKQEKDYIQKSKQSSSPIKKQHYLDMSKQTLDKALAILRKHKVID